MNFSRSFKAELKKAKIEAKEKAMADLIGYGWSEQDAYVFCYGSAPAYSDDWHRQKISEILNGDAYAKYAMKQHAKQVHSLKTEAAPETVAPKKSSNKQMSKDDVLKELVRIAYNLPENDPKRADILMKYADLTQMKKNESEKEDKTVHTYLPLTCKNCSLYINATKDVVEEREPMNVHIGGAFAQNSH